MKFQESIMHWWMGRKNPEELEAMMGQMMTEMMAKLGPGGIATMVGDMIPKMDERNGTRGHGYHDGSNDGEDGPRGD